MTKIAIYASTCPPREAGIAVAHFNLYLALRHHYDVRVFAFNDDNNSKAPEVVRMKSPKIVSKICRLMVKKYIRRFDPYGDIFHSYKTADMAFSVAMLNFELRRFSPDIIIMQDNYIPAYFVVKPKNSKLVWMSHHNYKRFENQPLVNQTSWMDIALSHSMELRAMRKADYVVCPSKYMEQTFRQTYPAKLPIKVIYNFVDEETLGKIKPFNIRSTLGVGEDTTIVYIPSGGSSVKGKRYVYEIIRRLSNHGKVAFYISGYIDNDLKMEISYISKKAKIYAPGYLQYENNLQVVASCDYGISPTLIENLSNAIIEGLFLGVPFVTFDTGGNREIIRDGVNGFIVPYLDVENLINIAKKLLENTTLLFQMKGRTLEPIRDIVARRTISREYQMLFKELLHQK